MGLRANRMPPSLDKKHLISGWGLYPVVQACVQRAYCLEDLLGFTRCQQPLLPQGNRRSYGDACLYGRVVSMLPLRHLLSFDAEKGLLRAQAGITLEEIIRFALPRGWFLPVTPGTKFSTLGGCIAADVHGKNHHLDGSLGRFVEEMDLVLADGSCLTCSRARHRELFWATLGGMGLTGFVYAATLRLKKVESAYVQVRSIKTSGLAEVCDLFGEIGDQYTYSVAWIDGLARGRNLGRGLLMLGEHAPASAVEEADPFKLHGQGRLSVPFPFPAFVLNPSSVRAFNALYYHRQWRCQTDALVHYDPYFYPLDAIHHWNRVYGRRGFLQYQFAVPFQDGQEIIQEILSRIAARGMASFLAVLKTFGPQEGLLSFPMPGYTLALDIPLREGSTIAFLRPLNQLIARAGGRVYLAKDAILERQDFEMMYPKLDEFRRIKQQCDPDKRFRSHQSDRLGLT
jgi:FAD/FMN-containing dehydrogenase